MPYVAITRTALQAMNEVKRKFGDESGVQLEDTDLIGWINDAQRDIAQREGILKSIATFTSVPGQSDYTSPVQNLLDVYALHYAGTKIPNVSFAQAEEDYISADNASESAQYPMIWYSWGGTFTFYPTPSTAETVKLYYSAIPATVVLSSDLLGVPDKWYNAVVHYVLMQAYEMDEDWQANQAKSQAYTEELTAQSDQESEHMTYGTITEVVPW